MDEFSINNLLLILSFERLGNGYWQIFDKPILISSLFIFLAPISNYFKFGQPIFLFKLNNSLPEIGQSFISNLYKSGVFCLSILLIIYSFSFDYPLYKLNYWNLRPLDSGNQTILQSVQWVSENYSHPILKFTALSMISFHQYF